MFKKENANFYEFYSEKYKKIDDIQIQDWNLTNNGKLVDELASRF